MLVFFPRKADKKGPASYFCSLNRACETFDAKVQVVHYYIRNMTKTQEIGDNKSILYAVFGKALKGLSHETEKDMGEAFLRGPSHKTEMDIG